MSIQCKPIQSAMKLKQNVEKEQEREKREEVENTSIKSIIVKTSLDTTLHYYRNFILDIVLKMRFVA